jgi:putative acyl-CoA dehydrogenase
MLLWRASGGAGDIEESIMPRLYREAPLSSIWEGSGNVICLDVLRAMKKHPEAFTLLREALTSVRGQSSTYDKFLKALRNMMEKPEVHPAQARQFVEYLALALQGSLLIRHAPDNVMAAFCHGRLGKTRGLAFGGGPSITGRLGIIDRAFPRE